ncbi:hypothetical protein B0H13DRAFT_2420400 [Mycena leptocephala]|nr:hypothetical protein B0H13DRAFT_2420400 [Mycena leptocephala]
MFQVGWPPLARWSIIDQLYIFKGVVYIVSNDPHKIPDLSAIYSKGVDIEVGEEAEMARLPDDTDIRIISTTEARALFGTGAQILDGVTYFVNDPPQLPYNLSLGKHDPPPPRRMWFNRVDAFRWRDYSTMNQWVVRSSFPDLTMEFLDDWDDRVKMGVPFVFERVVLADRSARDARAQLPALPAYGGCGVRAARERALVDDDPEQRRAVCGARSGGGRGTRRRPVITYISRQQWGRRMLIPADHEKLVWELRKLEAVYGYEVHIVVPEKMTRPGAAAAGGPDHDIDGRTWQWPDKSAVMKPNGRSTVMEFFYPGGFAHDYEYTNAGMTHYGFWDSLAFTSPDLPLPSYPEGFQGNAIPLDGAAVAELCIQRLTLEAEVDDG